jgi:hypothetical protein
MARSKNCLKCKYCKPFSISGTSKDWINNWYCSYYINTGIRGSKIKGSDPDNCLLFVNKKGGKQ